jgi:UDP-N-acetylglucosamine transferase subunit ALG13
LIFVTVGTQLAFDRLISTVDDWAAAGEGRTVFAQIGPTKLRPRHIEYEHFIPPEECTRRMLSASAIVSHAGMGTILTALERGKPLLVMPRRAALGEHRNEHQLATVRRFAGLGSLRVALDETELCSQLDELDRPAPQPCISASAPDDFVAGLRALMLGDPLTQTRFASGSEGARTPRVRARWARSSRRQSARL